MDKKRTSEQIMEPNIASALCYMPFIGCVPAVVFLAIHKDKQVRWNAVQSLFTYLGYVAIYFVLIPLMNVTIVLIPLAVFIGGIAWVGFLIVWLVLAARVNQNQQMKLPYFGDMTDKIVRK